MSLNPIQIVSELPISAGLTHSLGCAAHLVSSHIFALSRSSVVPWCFAHARGNRSLFEGRVSVF